MTHENDVLKPGTAFPLIKALQKLNSEGKYLTEIIVMSKNSADTRLRIFNSINHYGLKIRENTRSIGWWSTNISLFECI